MAAVYVYVGAVVHLSRLVHSPTYSGVDETTSTLAPAKLYKALVKDADNINIIPKAVEAIQSIETVEGNGGPGTIRPNGGSIRKLTKGNAEPSEEE
ncbi:START-like domain superfamily [Sesbania bispinosa]|nr:START-like domain superfamily [Sesbania bispinosa]